MEDSATLGSDMSAIAGLRGARPYGIASFPMESISLLDCSQVGKAAEVMPVVELPTETKAINPGGAGAEPPLYVCCAIVLGNAGASFGGFTPEIG